MRQPEYARVLVDHRGQPGHRIVLTAGSQDTERYQELLLEDPSAAEMMVVAFADACVDFEEIAICMGVRFGEVISVPGAAWAGTLQFQARLSDAYAQVAKEKMADLEYRFDWLLKRHFALAEWRPGHDRR
jgi:hypothetical protein